MESEVLCKTRGAVNETRQWWCGVVLVVVFVVFFNILHKNQVKITQLTSTYICALVLVLVLVLVIALVIALTILRDQTFGVAVTATGN